LYAKGSANARLRKTARKSACEKQHERPHAKDARSARVRRQDAAAPCMSVLG
jgi:hypothetical protein